MSKKETFFLFLPIFNHEVAQLVWHFDAALYQDTNDITYMNGDFFVEKSKLCPKGMSYILRLSLNRILRSQKKISFLQINY